VRKLNIDVNLVASAAERSGFVELPVRWTHARAVRDLPLLHHDPFDRMLVAQAISEPLRLLTSDSVLARYGDPVLAI
jgi:PIN domain nuclease of toxin-antitoxin system